MIGWFNCSSYLRFSAISILCSTNFKHWRDVHMFRSCMVEALISAASCRCCRLGTRAATGAGLGVCSARGPLQRQAREIRPLPASRALGRWIALEGSSLASMVIVLLVLSYHLIDVYLRFSLMCLWLVVSHVYLRFQWEDEPMFVSESVLCYICNVKQVSHFASSGVYKLSMCVLFCCPHVII